MIYRKPLRALLRAMQQQILDPLSRWLSNFNNRIPHSSDCCRTSSRLRTHAPRCQLAGRRRKQQCPRNQPHTTMQPAHTADPHSTAVLPLRMAQLAVLHPTAAVVVVVVAAAQRHLVLGARLRVRHHSLSLMAVTFQDLCRWDTCRYPSSNNNSSSMAAVRTKWNSVRSRITAQ